MQNQTLDPIPLEPAESEPVILKQDDSAAFIATLQSWAQPNNPMRARLAQLKRNVGEPLPGRGVAWFYSMLNEGQPGLRHNRADEYFLVATIFDLNRWPAEFTYPKERSLGASLRFFVEQTSKSEEARQKGIERVGKRLQILLDADFEEGVTSELAFRLRQTVQWLNGQRVGVDYAELLRDLYNWSPDPHYIAKFGDKIVQKKWAHQFYSSRTIKTK